MKFMKKIHLLFALCFLIVACGDPSKQTLAEWKKSPESIKQKFVGEYFAKNPEYIKKCIDRMSMLPETDRVRVMDAGNSCLTGLELKERKAAAAKNAKK